MNIHLVNFYKTWLHWATHENAQNWLGFLPQYGLCSNLSRYCAWLGLTDEDRRVVEYELNEQFNEHGRSSTVPFNMNDTEYFYELDKRSNPLRIQWCIDRIAEAEGHD